MSEHHDGLEPDFSTVENPLDPLTIIAQAPATIAAEFEGTDNSWLACFGSSVFLLETTLALRDSPSSTSQQRLEDLKIRLQKLKSQYPEHSSAPPDEIRAALLTRLDVFAENYPGLLTEQPSS